MNNNKYGIVLFKNTANLGDDIQVYAASRFYPQIDYIIDRESISEFVPNQKEKVKVVMNGWFNHDKTEFLISPYIDPLFISIHFTENDLYLSPGYSFLTDYAQKVMSKYKIGCRDNHTLEVLKKLGYKDVYFSSCMTTTINPIGNKKTKDYIVAVDMNPKIVEHLRKITNKEIIETTHWLFLEDNMTYDEQRKKIDEFDKANSEKREKMIQKHANLSFEKRMQLVEKQLKLYQEASLVITDRIHVGLPCLGLQTNVLLIYYDYNSDRIETFKELLVNCTEEEFLQMKEEDLLKIKNKNTYKKYREKIIKDTQKFISEETKNNEKLPDINIFKDINIGREKYLKKLYTERIDELKKENEKLKNENKLLEKDLTFYKKIKYSKSWKIIGKMYKLKAKDKSNL